MIFLKKDQITSDLFVNNLEWNIIECHRTMIMTIDILCISWHESSRKWLSLVY